jgi:hypothetical protein
MKADHVIIPPNSFALARTWNTFASPKRDDHLPGKKHLREVRNNRECHAVRT